MSRDIWWCDSDQGPGGACEVGDPQMCSGLDTNPGVIVDPAGARLHKNERSARNPIYPLRGDDPGIERSVSIESLDAFGKEEDWHSRQHRLLFHRYPVRYDLWPCKWTRNDNCNTTGLDIDREECNAFEEDLCYLPGTGGTEDCWHINCGLFVHSGDGIYEKCHFLGNFHEGICRKRRTTALFQPYPDLNRHMIGAQIPYTCMPFLDWQCWGKTVEPFIDDPERRPEYINPRWQEWNHCKLSWRGRPRFRSSPGNETIELRNRALSLLSSMPRTFCADQIHRTTVQANTCPPPSPPGRPYIRGEADIWHSFYNPERDVRVPRDDLMGIKFIQGVRLRVSDIPVTVEMVVTRVTITMSFRILILLGAEDVRDPGLGSILLLAGDDPNNLYPYVQFRINMEMRPRVTIDEEHEVEVLSDVYDLDEPTFSNGDRLSYKDGWRPPRQLEWWGNVGPFNRPQSEGMEQPGGGIEQSCEDVLLGITPIDIRGMETDWTDPFGADPPPDDDEVGQPRREVYNGRVRITGFGDQP